MALFTAAEVATVKAAYLEALANGIASVSLDGQSVQTYTPEQLLKQLQAMQAEVAGSASSGFGVRFAKLVPPGAG